MGNTRSNHLALDAFVKEASESDDFRVSIYKDEHCEVTRMAIMSGQHIGLETHDHMTQVLLVVSADPTASWGRIGDSVFAMDAGDFIIIPAGKPHDIGVRGFATKPLRLISVYGGKVLSASPSRRKRGALRR